MLNFLNHKKETSRLQCHLAGFKTELLAKSWGFWSLPGESRPFSLTYFTQQSAAGYNLGHLQDTDFISLFFSISPNPHFFRTILKCDRSHYGLFWCWITQWCHFQRWWKWFLIKFAFASARFSNKTLQVINKNSSLINVKAKVTLVFDTSFCFPLLNSEPHLNKQYNVQSFTVCCLKWHQLTLSDAGFFNLYFTGT